VSTKAEWPGVAVGELLVDMHPGFASGKHNSNGVGVPHLRPMNVSVDGAIDLTELKYVDPALADRPARRLQAGDVLFNNTNSPELVGKTALFDGDDEPAFSNHMTRLRVDENRADPAFLAKRLHHAWRQGWFAMRCNNHVSQASVGRDVLGSLEIALPPVETQRVVVSLLNAVDDATGLALDHLVAAARSVDRFRQAVAVAACSGRLTADLRTGRDVMTPDDDDADSDSRTPSVWERTTLKALCPYVTSGSRGWAKYYAAEGAYFIRSQDIKTDELELNGAARVRLPTKVEGKRTRVQPGDLLITITGANVTRAAFVRHDPGEAYVSQHVALIRPADPGVSEFLHLWMVSRAHGRGKLLADAYGAGKPGLNLKNIATTPVAVPPPRERDRIVQRVTELLRLADRVERRIVEARRLVRRQREAIEACAFQGKLVT
jgi:type I restriction enzyme, S subunit